MNLKKVMCMMAVAINFVYAGGNYNDEDFDENKNLHLRGNKSEFQNMNQFEKISTLFSEYKTGITSACVTIGACLAVDFLVKVGTESETIRPCYFTAMAIAMVSQDVMAEFSSVYNQRRLNRYESVLPNYLSLGYLLGYDLVHLCSPNIHCTFLCVLIYRVFQFTQRKQFSFYSNKK
jgi:hypothetical protein